MKSEAAHDYHMEQQRQAWDAEDRRRNTDAMKLFYKWLDEKYGDAHPHRHFMKMAWMEAFKQGMNYKTA
jgi:hypothetical protein